MADLCEYLTGYSGGSRPKTEALQEREPVGGELAARREASADGPSTRALLGKSPPRAPARVPPGRVWLPVSRSRSGTRPDHARHGRRAWGPSDYLRRPWQLLLGNLSGRRPWSGPRTPAAGHARSSPDHDFELAPEVPEQDPPPCLRWRGPSWVRTGTAGTTDIQTPTKALAGAH